MLLKYIRSSSTAVLEVVIVVCRIAAMELCTMPKITGRLLTIRRTSQLPPSLPHPQTQSYSYRSFTFVPPLHPPLLRGNLFLVVVSLFHQRPSEASM